MDMEKIERAVRDILEAVGEDQFGADYALIH